MSYYRQIGKSRDARKIIKELVERIAKLETQVNEIEARDYTQIIRSNNDRIVYVSNFSTEINAVVLDPNLKNYQLPFEPDGDKLRLWIKFNSTTSGGGFTDASGFEHLARLDAGSPVTQSGPVSGLPSLQFDGDEDTLAVTNTTYINLQGTSAGISISFNFNPSLIDTHGGQNRVISCKTDDSVTSRQWGYMIWVEPSGALFFHVRIANVFFTASKTFAFPSLNRWYKVFCTFNRATNTPRIYINGVLSTETVSTYVGGLSLPSASLSLYIGGNDRIGESKTAGFISDFRYWREKVVNQTEIDNIQQNGYTISFTLYPARAGVGNFASSEVTGGPGTPPDTPPPPPPTTSTLRSFTNSSFTTTSFMAV